MTTAGQIIIPYGDAPTTPASGKMSVYPKADKKLYYKDDDGVESRVTVSGHIHVEVDVIDLDKYTQAEVDAIITTVSGLLDDHDEMNNLDYASAGHTGFQPTGDYATNTDLTTVSGLVDDNVADINTNTGNIATNVADITSNTASIAVVSGTADTNASDIITNANAIATNTTLIGTTSGTLQTQIDTNVGDISTNASDISDNASDIVDNTILIATTSGILQADIDSNASDIGDNTTLITTTSGDIVSQIITNHSELNALDYASAGHTGFQPTGDYATNTDLATVSGLTDDNASAISTLDTKIDTTSGTLQTEIDNMTTTHSGLTDMPSAANTDHDGRYYTQTQLGLTTTGHTAGADLIGVPTLGSPTYTKLGDIVDLINSTGRTTGGFIVDEGNSKVTVSSGTGFIKAEDVDTSEIFSFDWTTTTGIAIPADTTRYIGIIYNDGTPIVDSRASNNYDLDSEFILGSVVNEGGTLHVFCNPWWVTDGITNVIERFRAEGNLVRDEHHGGLMLGVPGTRNIAVTAGTIWSLLNNFPISALDTTVTGTFKIEWTDTSDNWTDSDVTQYPVSQWNDLTEDTLQTLNSNWHANWWVYIEVDTDEVALIYPQAQYASAATAEAESPPTNIPDHISEHGIFIGRILIKQGTDAPKEVQSVFTTVFTASLAADHGNLAGLSDDDHTQYHNDARGDARYYTETELDGGQLDNRYYTETEADVITDKNAWDIANVSGTVDTNTSNISTNTSDIGDNTALIGTTSGTLQDEIDLKYNISGGTISGNVTIMGNLTVTGTEFITHVETVEIDDNLLLINANETGAGVTKGTAGIEVDRGTEPNYSFIFVEADDSFQTGISGTLQPVATRKDSASMDDTYVTYWDAVNYRLITDDSIAYTDIVSTGVLSTASGVLQADIDSNTSNISTNAIDIASNVVDIAVVSGTADTNTSDIATNVSDISDNTALIGTTSGTLQTEIDGKDNYVSWSFAVDGVTKDAITSGDVLDFVGGDNITVTRSADDQITISGSEGVTNHSELNELDYASAGHTGFQPTGDYATETQLTTASGDIVSQIPTDFYSTSEVDTISGSLSAEINANPGDIILDETPAADHTIQGMRFSGTIGESVNFGDVVFLKDSDSEYYFADATDVTEMPAVAMAMETKTDGNACELLAYGIVRDDTFDWQDIGQPIFVSLTGTTGNTLTQTAPSASGEQVQIVGWAMTVDTMFFNPNLAIVEIA